MNKMVSSKSAIYLSVATLACFSLLPIRLFACGMGVFGVGSGFGFDTESAVNLAIAGLIIQGIFFLFLKYGKGVADRSQPGTRERTIAYLLFIPNLLIWIVFGWGYLFVLVPVVFYETICGESYLVNVPLAALIPMIYFHSKVIVSTARSLLFRKSENSSTSVDLSNKADSDEKIVEADSDSK